MFFAKLMSILIFKQQKIDFCKILFVITKFDKIKFDQTFFKNNRTLFVFSIISNYSLFSNIILNFVEINFENNQIVFLLL